MQYFFQAMNCRSKPKYRSMMLAIASEELSHIEMLATMIGQLLEGAPVSQQEEAVESDPVVAAVMGGMSPKHQIVSGLGAMPVDSTGFPWNGRYIVASGNLHADFRANLTAESMERLQAVRLYHQTEDEGVRKMLGFMIERDTMHQNQWLAAIEELREDGLAETIVPHDYNTTNGKDGPAGYEFWNLCEGTESQEGRWAKGKAPDGKDDFKFLDHPDGRGQDPEIPPPGPRALFNTPQEPREGTGEQVRVPKRQPRKPEAGSPPAE